MLEQRHNDNELTRILGAGVGKLLTPKEELRLIRIAQKGFQMAENLGSDEVAELREANKQDGGKTLSKRKRNALRIIFDGENARNILTERNSRLVASIAKQFVGRSPFFGYFDLIAEGNLGFMHAIELFDEKVGCRLVGQAGNPTRAGKPRKNDFCSRQNGAQGALLPGY